MATGLFRRPRRVLAYMHLATGGKIRLGIVGCGRAATELHLPALQWVPAIQVAALVDLDGQRLESAGARFHIATLFNDYSALLDDPSIDAVAVCVPPKYHAEVALAVLDADKHLFVEKPLALSLEDCDRIVACAASSDRISQIGLNLRQHRWIREGRRIIQHGELGTVSAIRSCFTAATRLRHDLPAWRDRRDSGGGVLTEIGTHHFDLWRYLLGSEVDEVLAVPDARSGEECAAITARMSDGTVASAVFSERSYGNNEVEVFGSEGWLRMNLYQFDGLERAAVRDHAGDMRLRARRMWNAVRTLPQAFVNRKRGGDFLATYREQWQRFAEAIVNNGPVDATLADGRAAAVASLAAVESARTGRPVSPGGRLVRV